jgi:hypothetical protein
MKKESKITIKIKSKIKKKESKIKSKIKKKRVRLRCFIQLLHPNDQRLIADAWYTS